MPESTRLANEAWEALFTAQSRLLRRFQEQDAFTEVSMSEYDVLYTLSKADGPVRMGELGCSVLLSQPGLSRLIDRLVHRGLVERGPDPSDGRSVLVRLSAAGREAQKRAGRRHARQVAEAMAVLSPDELRHLSTLATRLVADPSREPSGTGTDGSAAREPSGTGTNGSAARVNQGHGEPSGTGTNGSAARVNQGHGEPSGTGTNGSAARVNQGHGEPKYLSPMVQARANQGDGEPKYLSPMVQSSSEETA